MLAWLWGCMVLAFKVGIGSALWSIAITIFAAIVTGIGAGIVKMME